MKEQIPKLMIVMCTLGGVLAAAVVDMGKTSPGELSRVHERDPDLAGGNDCAMCHGDWFESMGEACLECHQPVAEHIELDQGLHGRLAGVEADRCGTCHSEHHGASFSMVNAQTFARAGVADVMKFDHGMVGFEMSGKHLDLDCTECHENAELELVPEGEQRYMGLRSDCANCHEDPHEGSMRQACDNCHSQDGFEVQHFGRHSEFFPLFGSHAEATCLDCHDPESDHSLAAQMAGTTPHGERECATCHRSPHTADFVRGNATHEGLPPKSSCSVCHDPEFFSFSGDDQGLSAMQHAFSGFSIDVPHDVAECADCHGDSELKFKRRFPGRKADDCASCHESPHGKQFVNDGFSNNDCTVCHERQHFDPPAFGLEEHALAAIELTGKHADLDCHECHKPHKRSEIRIFKGTKQRCEDCHSDAHLGFFADFEREFAHSEGGDCATCHSTSDFHELPEAGFDHERFTGFAILGSHSQNRCESCHRRSPEADEHGRRFGRIAEHFGEIEDCSSCHGDPHGGAFDGKQHPKRIEGRSQCSRCHNETSFRVLPFGFDHELWTGFELRGKHAKADCSACHVTPKGNQLAQARSDEWPAPRGTKCSDCHQDPHAGQFLVDGSVDCARCHQDGQHFSDLRFRHNWDSRFALDEGHSKLECSACHKPVDLGDREVVRFRPLGTECADCHGVNEDVLRRKQRRKN